ncbi:MAG: S-layer homology domain-containing protein [Anaerolineales bacterium]
MDRKIITLLLGLLLFSSFLTGCAGTYKVEAAHVFDDVPDESTWGHAIQVLGYQGYVCGKRDRQFIPDATVNRAEMAVLLVRAKYGPDFVPESESVLWCQVWIDIAVADGLMSPDVDPTAPATRADVVALMWLMTQDARESSR